MEYRLNVFADKAQVFIRLYFGLFKGILTLHYPSIPAADYNRCNCNNKKDENEFSPETTEHEFNFPQIKRSCMKGRDFYKNTIRLHHSMLHSKNGISRKS